MYSSFYKYALIFAVLYYSFGCQAQDSHLSTSLKIVSYNVYVGMSQDTTSNKSQFVQWVKDESPDILAFQEMNNFTQKTLEKMAHQYGHPYAILLKEGGYPVALTSKYPITHVDKVVDNMHHGFIKAQIKDINVLVTHLSPHQYKKRQEEIDLILKYIENSPSKLNQWILMGDLNTYSPLDSIAYQDGKLLARIQQLTDKYPTRNNLANGKIDYSVIQRVLDSGFNDALKLTHPGFISSAPTHTIEHQFLSEQPEFRIDYIFVKGFTDSLIESDIIKDDFTHTHSDHYPVKMILKTNK